MDEVDLAAVEALSALYPTPIEIRALYREAGYDAPPPIANDARGVFLEIHAQSRMGGVVRFQKLVQVALKKYPHNEDLTRWVSDGGAPAPATASGRKSKPPEIGSEKASDTTNEERAARAAPPATPPGLPAAPGRSFAELLREPAARVLTASDEDLTPLQWEVEELIRRADPLGATPREVAEAKQLLSKIQNAHGRARQLAALRQRFEAAASRADRLAILRELSDLLRLADDPDRGAAERLANEFDVALGVDVQLRKLHKDFTGVWGAKVFWLAALTLLPLFVRFRSEMLGLEVSVASLIFAAYHGLGVYLWLSVRALEDPKHFTRYERALEAKRLSRMARVHGWIGLIVVVLLTMTFAVKVRIAFGDERYRLPAPNVLRALLGIPPATADPGPERPSNFEQTSCPVGANPMTNHVIDSSDRAHPYDVLECIPNGPVVGWYVGPPQTPKIQGQNRNGKSQGWWNFYRSNGTYSHSHCYVEGELRARSQDRPRYRDEPCPERAAQCNEETTSSVEGMYEGDPGGLDALRLDGTSRTILRTSPAGVLDGAYEVRVVNCVALLLARVRGRVTYCWELTRSSVVLVLKNSPQCSSEEIIAQFGAPILAEPGGTFRRRSAALVGARISHELGSGKRKQTLMKVEFINRGANSVAIARAYSTVVHADKDGSPLVDSLSPIDVPPLPPVQAGSELAVTLAADFISRDFWNRGRPCRDENHVGTRCIILGLHVELAEFGRDTKTIDVVVGEIEFDTAGWMGAQVLQGTVIDLL